MLLDISPQIQVEENRHPNHGICPVEGHDFDPVGSRRARPEGIQRSATVFLFVRSVHRSSHLPVVQEGKY